MRRASLALAAVLAVAAAAGAAPCLDGWRVAGRMVGSRATCRDGDPTCDLDGIADGACTFPVALCVAAAGCAAPVRVHGADAALLGGAVAALGTPGAAGCSTEAPVRVSLGRRARRTAAVVAVGHGRKLERARLRLVCLRAGGVRSARAVVVTTDFETGALVTVGVARRTVTHLDTPIHSDAVVRVAGDRVYVVNRYLGDNLQVLDPRHGFATLLECSTGPGSNPHDVAVVDPHKAYVTRYGRTELWIVDPAAPTCAGFFRGAIDLRAFADADGLPEMDQMAVVGDRLFVSLERLDTNRLFAPTGPSLLAVIDTGTDRVVGSVELAGANAFGDASGLVREPGSGKLVVATVGNFFRVGDGGLERIDPVALRSEGIFLDERTLGGNVTDFVLVSPTKGYAVVFVPTAPPRNVLVAFDPSRGVVTRRLLTSNYNLPDIALAPDGTLWVADQALPAPGIRIFDPASDRQLTRNVIDVGLPPFAMGFLP
jgi:hypothetical protein